MSGSYSVVFADSYSVNVVNADEASGEDVNVTNIQGTGAVTAFSIKA